MAWPAKSPMFLFTTPPSRASAKPAPVIDAIRYGAERTGTGFDYLVKTAQKESALDPTAKAKTSSATGLFQFIEQTWLGLIKSDGDKYGLAAQAHAISEGEGGYAVGDAGLKRDILALRNDPKLSAVMAGVLTQKNGETLAAGLGRPPAGADLYIAHVLGANGAISLIRKAQASPTRSAATEFPEAAAANRAIFFDRSGRARGAGEVYALLAANHAAQAQTHTAAPTAASTDAQTAAPAYAVSDGPALHGLFRTEGSRGPVSNAVAKLWTTSPRGGAAVAAAKVAAFYPSSIPRTEIATASDVVPTAAVEEAPRLVSVPLPPVRPTDLDGTGARNKPAATMPLDLLSFTMRRKAP